MFWVFNNGFGDFLWPRVHCLGHHGCVRDKTDMVDGTARNNAQVVSVKWYLVTYERGRGNLRAHVTAVCSRVTATCEADNTPLSVGRRCPGEIGSAAFFPVASGAWRTGRFPFCFRRAASRMRQNSRYCFPRLMDEHGRRVTYSIMLSCKHNMYRVCLENASTLRFRAVLCDFIFIFYNNGKN